MKLSRFCVSWTGLLGLIMAFGLAAEGQPASVTNTAIPNAGHRFGLRRPSLILVTCQGLSLSDLSCYGQTKFQTPNLDRLAGGGARFANYRAGGDDLARAQAVLMTSHDTPATGGAPLIAACLQQAGYRTGLMGEWLLGGQPWEQGFDEFGGFLTPAEAANWYADFIWRYAPNGVREGTNYVRHPRFGREKIYRNAGGRKEEFAPDLLVGLSASFMHTYVPDQANHYRPVFLLLSLPVPQSASPGKDDYPVPTDAPYSGESWPQAAKNRAALMTHLDNAIGGLLEQFKTFHATNNVALFIAGTTAPEPFASTNLNFLRLPADVRGGTSPDRLRVPLIVYWPGCVHPGQVITTPASAADFAATAREMAGLEPDASLSGQSLLPALLGKTKAKSPAAPAKSPP
jgi:uncharacterized sulfatase